MPISTPSKTGISGVRANSAISVIQCLRQLLFTNILRNWSNEETGRNVTTFNAVTITIFFVWTTLNSSPRLSLNLECKPLTVSFSCIGAIDTILIAVNLIWYVTCDWKKRNKVSWNNLTGTFVYRSWFEIHKTNL